MKFLRRLPQATFISLSLALCLVYSTLHAADKTEKQAAPQPARNAPVNPITQAAVQAGVLSCAARINQVTNFLVGKNKMGAALILPNAQPDQKLISGSMEITGSDSQLAYASASFAPNQANGCGALYETVYHRPDTCSKVAAREFKGFKPDAKLGKQTVMLSIGPSSRVFLMPVAGNGCVVIKKEVIFN